MSGNAGKVGDSCRPCEGPGRPFTTEYTALWRERKGRKEKESRDIGTEREAEARERTRERVRERERDRDRSRDEENTGKRRVGRRG